jgi:hypothetical protein
MSVVRADTVMGLASGALTQLPLLDAAPLVFQGLQRGEALWQSIRVFVLPCAGWADQLVEQRTEKPTGEGRTPFHSVSLHFTKTARSIWLTSWADS